MSEVAAPSVHGALHRSPGLVHERLPGLANWGLRKEVYKLEKFGKVSAELDVWSRRRSSNFRGENRSVFSETVHRFVCEFVEFLFLNKSLIIVETNHVMNDVEERFRTK